jgi:hypothetical protein
VAQNPPDQVDQAMSAGHQVPGARVEFVIHTPNTSGGRTSKGAAVELPADLTEPEAFAFVEAAVKIAREIVLQAEARRGPQIVVPKPGLAGLIRNGHR